MTANGLYSNKVAFTTEAALQIPNSNMEAAVTNSGTNTKNNIFVSPWGTNNAMTTSQGADVAYCKTAEPSQLPMRIPVAQPSSAL